MSAPQPPTGFPTLRRDDLAEFWVVRHGETEWNATGRYQGQTDVALSPTGVSQARQLAARLTGLHFGAVYSSDLTRALETARLLAGGLDSRPEVVTLPGLREIDVGQLSGKVRSEIEAQFPGYVAALRADPWHVRRPGGESMADLAARATRTFDALCAQHPGQRLLIVTHGGVVRVAVSLAIGGRDKDVWARLSVANTSITRVALGQLTEGGAGGERRAGQLIGFNDVAHLERVTWPDTQDDVTRAGREASG